MRIIPPVPGDNSQYLEGKSRYVWLPDGDGTPQLVDLHAPINDKLTQIEDESDKYLLFTRRNTDASQILLKDSEVSIKCSNYNASWPLKVIVHGWNNNRNSKLNIAITAAILEDQEANVIVMDWSSSAQSSYVTAANSVISVGKGLGEFLIWLLNITGSSWNNVHLIGFSLGAHIVGNAGRVAGGKPARITGLDPAGPLWSGSTEGLNKASGQYVEVIHTDGGLLGIYDCIADADFYPNGGKNPQPGCLLSTCSHSRAHELFASSIRTNHFVGRLCKDLHNVQNGTCSGTVLKMGNGIMSKRGGGIYLLETGKSWPF
ncbi:hypothetical protein ACJJTC_010230 [Scirpophaga incertulas]